ncbi:MAG: pentapeptide repeat-containing protein [Gammaproteobacteria bacterium]|nr:pentapeptide repeat-containing protein [Gammaproteobacteria bacterium]
MKLQRYIYNHKNHSESNLVQILPAIVIVIVLVLILLVLVPWYGEPSGEILRGIYIEATGAVMDILVFGIIVALFTLKQTRAENIRKQKELIDDFKLWNSDEAHYRIAGALRRLNLLNCTKVNFSGLLLSNFKFKHHEIESIEGSTFYDGSWGTLSRRDRVKLERVDFTGIDCRNVVFSKFNPFSNTIISSAPAIFKDCNFQSALLQNAIFKGSHLVWSEKPPQEIGKWIDIDHGESSFCQTYRPPFDDVDLAGVSFEDVSFENADFRDCLNIENCSFNGARGLETCLFDNEEVKKLILADAEADCD